MPSVTSFTLGEVVEAGPCKKVGALIIRAPQKRTPIYRNSHIGLCTTTQNLAVAGRARAEGAPGVPGARAVPYMYDIRRKFLCAPSMDPYLL